LWFKDLAAADPYYGLPTASLVFGALSVVVCVYMKEKILSAF
jgi:hypothetical protein